jgi:hypothetical protein
VTKSRLLVILKKFYKFSKNLRSSSPPAEEKLAGGRDGGRAGWPGGRAAGWDGGRAGRWTGRTVDWQDGGLAGPAGWPGEGPREKRPRSVRVVSQVRGSCVPGPRNVPGPATPERPKGRLPSPVPGKSADLGRKSLGPATERPRTGDRKATDRGRKGRQRNPTPYTPPGHSLSDSGE